MYDAVLDSSKNPEGTPELFHGYTYSGIPAAVAAGLAVQDIFDKEDIFKRAKEMSPYFQDGLHSLKDLKEVVSIRGYGMMGGVEMRMKDKPGKSGFQTFKHCYDAGVNFKNTGDTLIIAPQFICEKKHIDENGLATRLQFQKSRVNIDPLLLKPKYQVCLIVINVIVYSFIQTIPPRRRPKYNEQNKTMNFKSFHSREHFKLYYVHTTDSLI